MEEIYVSEVMTKNVTACSPDTAIKDVIKILSRNSISSLIITENDEPVGIITERDLVAIMEEMLNDIARDHLPIVHFMTSPTLTIHSHITLREAVRFAIDKNIRHLPVVDRNNKLIGLLTQTNMVRSLSYIAFTLSRKSS
ncbi:MAG: CBS domain-containing protein [Proteobacteria bacterium]|nr:CBS domain-containing protein [Pseudomonadota bacterium]